MNNERKLDRTRLEPDSSPVKVHGDPNTWVCLLKASMDGQWMKSTKAAAVPGGCLVQVTTLEISPDGSRRPAESVTFVPGVSVADLEMAFNTQ